MWRPWKCFARAFILTRKENMWFIEMKLYKQQVWDIKFYYKWWKQPLSTSQYRASQTNAPLISCKPSIFAQPPRALPTKLPNRWNIHLIKRSISSVCVCAHMIVRATTINLPFVHPCKLKGPKNARFRRKYNITNTFTAMNSWFVKNALLAQTARYRQPKTLWRIETALQAHFCYDLTSKPPIIYC